MSQDLSMPRRRFLFGSAATLGTLGGLSLLAACGDDDDGATSPSGAPAAGGGDLVDLAVQLMWIKNVEFGGNWVADDRGFYVDEGLNVDLIAGGPNVTNIEQLVTGGGADLGMSTDFFSFVNAVKAGAEVVLIGVQYQTSPVAMISLEESPIVTPGDIVGKRIGGRQGRQQEIEAVLSINGLPLDYTFVPTGFDPEALVQGDIDALTGFATNQGLIVEKMGIPSQSIPFAEFGLVAYSGMLYANRSVLETRRDDVVGYLRATIKGWEQNNDEPEVAARLAVENYGADLELDLAQQIEENTLQVDYVTGPLTEEKGLFWFDPELIQSEMYPAFEAAGLTDPPDPDSFSDTSLLEEIFDGSNRVSS